MFLGIESSTDMSFPSKDSQATGEVREGSENMVMRAVMETAWA